MRADDSTPKRYPWWQLILIGLAGLIEAILRPIGRMWRSEEPIETYALVHFLSAGGDALVAIALADSIFFSVPVGQAQGKVAAYLALTMAPLAVAGPLLVPLLDRAGPRRAISLAAAAGRTVVAIYAAPRVSTLVLFPAIFLILVLSKVHSVTKNGLAMAYAGSNEGLMRLNARLGRVAVGGALLVAPFGIAFLKLWGAAATLYLAAIVYFVCAAVNLRLPHAAAPQAPGEVGPRGRIPVLAAPAAGAAGLKAASGFLLFLLAFSLRSSEEPAYWFGLLAAAAVAGSLLGDLVAPRLPERVREEVVVVGCLLGAGIAAFLAFEVFGLPALVIFALVVGVSTEFGRLGFQALMQRHAPGGALGRVFVRYEVMFQLAWVGGALLPALLPLEFRDGILILAGFYLLVAAGFFMGPAVQRRRERRAEAGDAGGGDGG